jgi:N-acetylmuramoyl-L-alanine amidase
MWIQRASCTSQLDKKSMLHLPRNKHGQDRRRSIPACCWCAGALLFLALGAAFSKAGAADVADPHHVTAVRFWSLGSVTRIAIETDGDFQVKSDRLDNPDRLFFDLTGTKPTLSRKSITVIPVEDHFVRQIRVAEPQHNVTRVVLDLATAAEPTVSRLDNPTRLIIELRASGSTPEITKAPAPVRALPMPTPAEPIPAARPVERRPFTPPPAARPVVIPVAEPKEAWIEPPPQLKTRNSAPPAAVWLAVKIKPGPAPAPAVPVTVFAKPASAPISPAIANLASTAQPQPINLTQPITTVQPVTLTQPTSTTQPVILTQPTGTTQPGATQASVTQPIPAPPSEPALPAKRNSSGDRSMIRVLGLKVGRIVLDPGHGGHDTGTVGPQGLREKDLVLDVAQRLGRLIEARMGSEVIFTRSDDTFIPLETRTAIANEAKADLFLSIHANSSPLRSAAGVETYYLNFTTSRSALDLASRENSGAQMSVSELQGLLEKIALKDKVEESREFASRVQTALYTLSAKTTDARSKDRGVKRAPFVVLIGASMPSVLAEIGFVSNAHDESVMRREEYRERTAEALYKGISNYAGSLSHFQVAQRH